MFCYLSKICQHKIHSETKTGLKFMDYSLCYTKS